MPQKPETRFKLKVRPLLEAIPHSCWEKIQQVAIRGTPDFIGCVNGKCVVIELKVGQNTVDLLQEYKLAKWNKAGAYSCEMHPGNYKVIIELLKEL